MSTCAGVFVNGTTGESLSLTVEERERALGAWRRVWPSDRWLFAHVGHNSLEDAKRLARHAADHGADAVAAIAPGFFKPAGIELELRGGRKEWWTRKARGCIRTEVLSLLAAR